MITYPDLPWARISDYLLEVGSARNTSEFALRALSCLVDLVPFDNNGIFGIYDPIGRVDARATIAESTKWIELHNNYYSRIMPVRLGTTVKTVDWHEMRHTEYVTDFIKPQGIRSSLAISLVGESGRFSGGLAIHRTNEMYCFTGQELVILEAIQPHLSNYFAMHALLATYDEQLPDAAALASDHQCLTRKEAEIAALLCRRFSTGMIATRLMITRMTVYRHIANIFAKMRVFNRDELLERLLSTYYGKDPRCEREDHSQS